MLCDATSNKKQVEVVVACAADVRRVGGGVFSHREVASICRRETSDRSMSKCVKQAISSSTSSLFVTSKVVLAVCISNHIEGGDCLSSLLGGGMSMMDPDVPEKICSMGGGRGKYRELLGCVRGRGGGGKLVTTHTVDMCMNEEVLVGGLRLVKILSEDNDVAVTAGRRFLLSFEVADQWGGGLIDDTRQPKVGR